jgi:hypothetical protein
MDCCLDVVWHPLAVFLHGIETVVRRVGAGEHRCVEFGDGILQVHMVELTSPDHKASGIVRSICLLSLVPRQLRNHGSTTFSDIGHVLVSVEPFQNVPGCAEPAPNPNGALVDSTNNTLSHELIESITDPDPNLGPPTKTSGWVAASSLVSFGHEIEDLCVILTSDPAVMLNGRKYQLQSEYSNRYHACAFAP